MAIEILLSLAGGVISLLAGGIASNQLIQRFIRRILGIKESERETYSEKLSNLTESLMKASQEVDSVLSELAQVARDREKAVQKLETELAGLETHEKQLKQRIQELENVPIPVAEHFAKLIVKGEKRSAWRDYILFGAGVVVSTVIAIILKLVGLG